MLSLTSDKFTRFPSHEEFSVKRLSIIKLEKHYSLLEI